MRRYGAHMGGRRDAELAGVRRMREVLRTGKWPTGLPITFADREVIAHNIALVERKHGAVPA